MQARYYDPIIGRFYGNDPVDVLGHMSRGYPVHGFGRFTYVNNNPYRYTDPDGKSPREGGSSSTLAGVILDFALGDDHKNNKNRLKLAEAKRGVGERGKKVAKTGDKFTKEVVKRGKPGRDGGQSQHVIEKVDGQTTSTTHQVVKDGRLIHQHQDHVGKHGTVRRFADELTGTETINAPKVKDTMTGGRLGFPPGS